MKLVSTLPAGAGMLHAIVWFQAVALLFMAVGMAPLMEQKTGLMVSLPSSAFQIDRYPRAVVLTLTADVEGRVFWGREAIEPAELERRLQEKKWPGVEEGAIIIKADRFVTSERLRAVAELCLAQGFKVILAGAAAAQEGGR